MTIFAGVVTIEILVYVDDQLLLCAIAVLDIENAGAGIAVAATVRSGVGLRLGKIFAREQNILGRCASLADRINCALQSRLPVLM